MVFAKGDILVSLQDQPERRSFTKTLGGNSRYSARWGICLIGSLDGRMW